MAALGAQANNPTILVVEDDYGTREALCEILHDAGYSVLPAENGLRALDWMAKNRIAPALILLDLAMPVMDGPTFLSRLRQQAELATIPVIVMSGDFKARRLRFESPDNVMEVLSKPIDVSRMMGLIKQHAAGQHHDRGN